MTAIDAEMPTAVVTGAASGIGRAFVLALAKRGYTCVGADIDDPGLKSLSEEAARAGAIVVGVRADVSVANDVDRLAQHSFERFGRVDLLICNAGILSTGKSWEMPLAQWRQILEVNLLGMVNTVHHFVPRLLTQGSGHIVTMASAAALTSHAYVGAYSASKHGVLALSECLARELESEGSAIRVSVVFPGAVDTDIARQLLTRPESEQLPIDRVLADLSQTGSSASQVADFVLSTLDDGTFGIFTHPKVKQRALERLAALLDGSPPSGAKP